MKEITSSQLRTKFLEFFKNKSHAIIRSSSLIPENDPTVLFTTAGMHPLTPYLLGQKHPQGNRLANVQKCVRTGDIDEVGDNSHLTFFEMLGNWSLEDYFKKESISWSWEFLTSPDYLGIDKNRLAVSVFAGDEDAPRDEESANLWKQCGLKADKIFYLPKKNNWWGPAGVTGPCGPDTEIFFVSDAEKCCEECSPACDCGKYLEIWNNVFMQYNKQTDGSFVPLEQKNVDTGMGLERTVAVLNGFGNVYETDAFKGAIILIEKLSGEKHLQDGVFTRSIRIVADHLRTAVFMLGDEVGVVPGNVDQGYVLRRLIRRATRIAGGLNIKAEGLAEIAAHYIRQYENVYSELKTNEGKIIEELLREIEKFNRTLEHGEKEFERIAARLQGSQIDDVTAFRLYDTFGFPIELTVELAKERGLTVDVEGYRRCFAEHQKKSQAGSEQKFKGGLADSSEQTTKLHTATHLLQAALIRVLGDEVKQKGSNITVERLRFDFSFHRPMTEEEIAKTQGLVNEYISAAAPIVCEEMTVERARGLNAIGLFGDKYGETVKVYTMGQISREICGGPHADNTGELGRFEITKEQSSSSGVRRIKAELK